MDHNVTPRMTRHALARCQEMGIPARLAKAIWRKADLVYPSPKDGRDAVIAASTLFPGYAVVVTEGRDGHPTVLTVVFRTTDTYTRKGHTYETKDKD